MRSTYLILVSITQLIFLALAILSPIYITPGWYIWSAFFIVLFFTSGAKVGDRIDEWNQIDRLKNL